MEMNSASSFLQKLSWKERLSYGVSDFACNSVFTIAGSFLMLYYTDVAGIAASAVGTLFLVARIVDALQDPIQGLILDRTNTRWGKSRPWWLWFSIPFAIISVLLFSVPDISSTGKIIWIYITYILFNLLYTIINVPVTSILPSLTEDVQERTVLSSIRQLMGNLGGAIVNGVTLIAVAFIGGGSGSTSQRGWTTWMIVVSFFAVILLMISFKNTRERSYSQVSNKNNSVKESLKAAKRNWPWFIIIFVDFIRWIGLQTQNNVAIYFFKYNFNNEALGSFILSLQIVAVFSVALCPFFVKRLGKRNTMLLGFIVQIMGQLMLFVGDKFSSAAILIFATVIVRLGFGFVAGVLTVMQADTVDYGEWKNGVRAEGFLTSFSGFAAKFGMGLGGSITGWILNKTGYIANQTQTSEALFGIQFNYIWFPLIVFSLALIALLFYKVDNVQNKMQDELKIKRQKESNA